MLYGTVYWSKTPDALPDTTKGGYRSSDATQLNKTGLLSCVVSGDLNGSCDPTPQNRFVESGLKI